MCSSDLMRNAQLLMNYKSFFGLSDDNCDSCPNEFIVCSCHGGNIRTINFDYPGVVEIGDEAYFCNIGFSGDDRYILYSKCDRWD